MAARLSWMVLRAVAGPTAVASAAVLGVAAAVVGARLAADPLTPSLPAELWLPLALALGVPLLPAAIPLALFAGVVAGVARLESDGAIDAARALGARPRQLVAPTVALATLAAAATFAAGAWGEPWGRHHARAVLAGLQGPDLRPRDTPLVITAGDTVLGARRVDGGGVLHDVLLWRDGGAWLAVATRGQVTLRDGALQLQLHEGELHLDQGEGGVYARARLHRYRTELPVSVGGGRGREPFELAPGALLDTLAERRAAGLETRFHELALHRRLALPLAVPLLAWLAWPLGRGRARGGGRARGAAIAVVVGLAYYLVLRLGDHGLRVHHWPPLLAAYLGTATLAAAAALGARWRWRR